MTGHGRSHARDGVGTAAGCRPGESPGGALEHVPGEDGQGTPHPEQLTAVPEAGVSVPRGAHVDAAAPGGQHGDGHGSGQVARGHHGRQPTGLESPGQSPDRPGAPGPQVRRRVVVHAASFHLVRHPSGRALAALLDVPRLQVELRRTPGLRFWRLLGSGRGQSMTLGADLRRWALFAVWESPGALADFVGAAPATRRWSRSGAETWHAALGLREARGTWGGTALVVPGVPEPEPGGAAAFLTRASIRPRRLRAFYAAIRPVEGDLLAHPDRLRSVGVGEWPVARQATFSLWRDAAAARAFAFRPGAHAEVIRRTRAERWYSEELFARFSVRTLAGTWDGTDPLD